MTDSVKDIFNKNQTENSTEWDQTKKPDVKTDDDAATTDQLLAGIVNETGEPKYTKVDEALKGAAHAQKHIKDLESELAELKDKGNASEKLDELLNAVKSQGSGQGEETSTMKPEDVLGIVQDYFKDTKAAEAREDNVNNVIKVFRDRYGKDASDKLYGKADDLGLSQEEINSMIANNPKAALKVLGENTSKTQAGQDPVTRLGSETTRDFQGKPSPKPTSIMGPTSTKNLNDAWAVSKQKTLERLGLSET